MISFSKYKSSSLVTKADYLHQNGTYLLSRTNGDDIIELFAVGNFFAEICLSEESVINDRIVRYIKPFFDLRLLTPYLTRISIKEII